MPLHFDIVALGPDGKRRMLATDLAGHRGIATMRGFNISGHCKRDGLPCRSTEVARHLFEGLARDGFNLVRLPIIWELLSDEVERGLVAFVDAAAEYGLYVLVDLHQDILGTVFRKSDEYRGTGFPRALLRAAYESTNPKVPWQDPSWEATCTWQENYQRNAQLAACFEGLLHHLEPIAEHVVHVAGLFAGRTNVIGYDVINEPMKPLWNENYHRYYRAIAAVLPTGKAVAMPRGDWLYKYLPRKLPIFVDTADAIEAGFTPGQLADLRLSTPHIYSPPEMAFPIAPSPSPHVVQIVADWHARHDLPFIVGEFGVPAKLRNAAGHLATWVERFEALGISWCLWNLNPEADPNGNDHWCGEHMSIASRGPGETTQLSNRYAALHAPFVVLASGELSERQFVRGWTFRITVGRALQPGLATKIVVPTSLGDFDVTRFTGFRHRKEGNVVTFNTDDGEVTIELTKHEAP